MGRMLGLADALEARRQVRTLAAGTRMRLMIWRGMVALREADQRRAAAFVSDGMAAARVHGGRAFETRGQTRANT